MLVSDLIKFRNDFINKVNQVHIDQSIINIGKILQSTLTENSSVVVPIVEEKIIQTITQLENIHQQVSETINPLVKLIDNINHAIDSLAHDTLIKSDNEPYKYYHKLDFSVDDAVDRAIKSRIHHRADWHFPGMQLGCRNSEYTSELVANDPLYLCDLELQFIDKVSERFNDIYNRRLRKYLIPKHDLSQLPQNQFGFIFSWMLFNYSELSMVNQYLMQVIKLLRPGGIIIFSYNNGDIYESCQLSEIGGMSWIPKRHLHSLALELGYEITDSFDLPNTDSEVKYISWIELRKPGELSTLKRSQAQGLIGRK